MRISSSYFIVLFFFLHCRSLNYRSKLNSRGKWKMMGGGAWEWCSMCLSISSSCIFLCAKFIYDWTMLLNTNFSFFSSLRGSLALFSMKMSFLYCFDIYIFFLFSILCNFFIALHSESTHGSKCVAMIFVCDISLWF